MTTVATQRGSIPSTLCMEAMLVKQIFECLYEYERRFRRCCFLKPKSISFHFFFFLHDCAFSCLSISVSMFHPISEHLKMSIRISHGIAVFKLSHLCSNQCGVPSSSQYISHNEDILIMFHYEETLHG